MSNFFGKLKNIASKCFGWLCKSNRWKHFIAGFFLGGIVGIIPVIVAAFSVEYKDWCWNGSKGNYPIFGWSMKNGFDWLDLAATVLGGIVICVISVIQMGERFNFFTGIF